MAEASLAAGGGGVFGAGFLDVLPGRYWEEMTGCSGGSFGGEDLRGER